MDRVLPFWDRLFPFLAPLDQVAVMLCSVRLRNVGQLPKHVTHRVAFVQRRWRNKNTEFCKVRDEHVRPEYIHPELQTQDLCLKFVQRYSWNIEYIHPEKQTLDLCLMVVQSRGEYLQNLSFEMRSNPNVCLAALIYFPRTTN